MDRPPPAPPRGAPPAGRRSTAPRPRAGGAGGAGAPRGLPGVAFLLSQLGTYSARLWAEALEPLQLDPRQAATLRLAAAAEGGSQQALAAALRVPESRMVALVDELEERGLLERRRHPTDRRARALHLTARGREVLEAVWGVSAAHEARLTAGLGAAERRMLDRLLRKLAAAQGLLSGVHPGLAHARPPAESERNDSRPLSRERPAHDAHDE